MHRFTPARSPWLAVAVVCAAAVAGGCTMCPDPFDYSGPVPNGSSPQNDFRARSNGIRPLLAAPRPWPPVVQDEPGKAPSAPGGGPTTSVLVAAATEAEEGSVVPVVGEALDQPAAADADATPARGEPMLAPVPQTESEGEPSADPGPAAAVTAPAITAPSNMTSKDTASDDLVSSSPSGSDTASSDAVRPNAASSPEAWPDTAPRLRSRTRSVPVATEGPAPAALDAPAVAPRPVANGGETPGWRPRR